MNDSTRLICPRCSTPLPVSQEIRVGRKIACAKCKVAFSVRPEDVERAATTNRRRLAVVLVGALCYLLVGAGLATYCFQHNVPRQAVARTESKEPEVEPDKDLPSTLKEPVAPKSVRVTPEEQRKIDKAIADGVWFLKEHVRNDGTWEGGFPLGVASLCGLTLLECGVPVNDVVVKKVTDYVRRSAASVAGQDRSTYQLALAILFLDRLGEYQDTDLIQYLALCLVAGQQGNGGWTYGSPLLNRDRVQQLLAQLGDPTVSLKEWHGVARNGDPFGTGGWDNSNTQFAILALWVARRHQVPIQKPLELAEKHFRDTQLHAQPGAILADANNVNLDGSWYYNGGSNALPWPSMTCSGLLGLAIGRGVKDPAAQDQKPLDDPAVKAGLAMLAREIDRPGERRSPDHYFLWSMERVAVLYDLDLIDGKDWYVWGYKLLLARQDNNGCWPDTTIYGNYVNTCFALLFLKRANLARDLTDKLQFLAHPEGPDKAP
jgi:hypothetical protein